MGFTLYFVTVDVHRTIGRPPACVTRRTENEIRARVYSLGKFNSAKPVFQAGGRVRISYAKYTFRNWSTEIFVISKIHYTDPITYCIKARDGEEIYGKFYKDVPDFDVTHPR